MNVRPLAESYSRSRLAPWSARTCRLLSARTRLEAIGLPVTEAHPFDRDALAAACAGSTCVVSALNGVREVMIDRQGVLLEAAVQADVPRFIPSDHLPKTAARHTADEQ